MDYLSVCIVASAWEEPADAALAAVPGAEVVVEEPDAHGGDAGRAATAALARAQGQVVLLLGDGERLDPSCRDAVAAFAASGAALGVVSIVTPPSPDGTVRRARETRLARREGARVEGSAVPRLAHEEASAPVPTDVTVSAAARQGARLEALHAEHAAHPADAWVSARLAEALAETDPVSAVDLASSALDVLPVDSPEAQGVVLTLATALYAGGGLDELLGLVGACRERYPRWPDLRLFEALAHGSAGRTREMIAALEACLAIGEAPHAPGTIGAGTILPLFHLGGIAERSGDPKAASALYARALPFPMARAALERLADAAAARADVPPRLVDNGIVAMKACRHGTFAYPVNDKFVGRALDLYGEWCEAELEVLAPMLAEGDVVLDVGANIGTHTVFFAKAVGPKGKVLAFEPQRFAHGLLAANVATNGLANVDCRREAVGAAAGSITVPELDPAAKANFGGVAVGGRGGGERVLLGTIDALRLPRCALIKVDVEGFELDVLVGARETILRTKPVLFVENNTVERSAELLHAIHALGYRAYWQIAPYFDADNHFGNGEDVFAIYQPEANLVCVPKERTLPGMLEATEGDDFVKALVRSGVGASARTPARKPRKAPVTPIARVAPPAPKPVAKRPLTVVACIPGREFSGRFFDAWNALAERCRDVGIRLVLSRTYDAVVYYARNKVVGGDVRRGPRQAPWGGEVDYDYMLWIDSDVVFRFEDFQRLLAHKVDMVAGLYLMADNTHLAAVEHMDEARFQKEGRFEFLTPAKLEKRSGLVPVDYCGFGFVLVRRGVFERLEYPWFRPIYVEIGACREFTSEDVGFCMLAKKAGIPMLVDPKVVVGHEKAVVLAPPTMAKAA